MIRHLTSLIFLISFCISFGQSLDSNFYGTAYYGKSMAFKNEPNEIDKFILEAMRNSSFILNFNRDEAEFKLENKVELDGYSTRGAETLYGGGKGIYYSNKDENFTIHQREFGGELYLIEGEFTLIKWKLLNESKSIQNYLCYKAIGTKKILSSKTGKVANLEIEAWYCPELPIPFGPLGFNNLPGLIIELKDRSVTYYLKKIEFNNSIEISRPTKGVKISESSFEIIGKKTLEEKNQRSSNRNDKDKG